MFADTLNFARKLTFLKLWNILIVQLSYHISVLRKRPIVWGRPWFVSIEPASVCNLSCPQCPVGAGDIVREKKFMIPDEYKQLLEQISDTTSMLSLYFQGEPLMHKEFAGFVRRAAKHNIYTQTSTNGQMLTEEVCRGLVNAGLDRIIISLDGADQESYEAYRRGGELRKVKEGIRNLNRIRRETGSEKPYIVIQFLVFRHNWEQIHKVKKLAKEWGADKVRIKSAQVEYPKTADEWIPVKSDLADTGVQDMTCIEVADKYSRYEKSPSGEWRLKGSLQNRCKRLWQTTVITSDGIVVPCCFDKRAQFPMGRVGEKNREMVSGFALIWKGKAYQDFRKKVLSDRKMIAICTNCTEGMGRIFG